MANTLLTIDMITNEALAVLENELTFTKRVNREYNDQFAKSGAKIGDTLNIRKPPRYLVRDGAGLQVQSSTETSVPVTLTQKGVDISFSTKELTLDIDDFSSRFIKPMVAQLANQIDYDGLQLYKNIYNTVGTAGTPSNSLTNYLGAGVKLDYEAAPMGDRSICLEPQAQATIVNGLTNVFNPSKAISEQYTKGSMGTAVGFDWYMDQNVASHTAGVYAANVAGGAVTVTNTVTSGSTIVTGGWTQGDLLAVGDVVEFTGVYAVNPLSRQSTGQLRQFVITATPTAASVGGAMTITVSPALVFSGQNQTVTSATGTLPSGATLTVDSGTSGKVSRQNLAFCRDAFTIASADLELPQGVWMAKRVSSKKLGMSIRAVKAYDINSDNAPLRLDVLYGWATMRPELACRIQG